MKEGWEIEHLGELCQIVNGGTPKTNVNSYWDGEINWITPADLGKLTSKLVGSTKRKITQIGLEKSSAKLFPPYSIILSTRAPIGHLAINTAPMCTNQGCRGLVPNNRLDVWYLYYFLWNNVDLLDSLGSGTTFKELSTKALSNVRIPTPSLPEQQRIVSIIDEAFEAIDKAIENTQKNLQNAKELFESCLNEVFENGGEGWSEKRFDNICILQRGFDLPTQLRNEGVYPLVSSNGITDRIDLWKVDAPGVVTGRSGTIGHVHYIEEKYWPLNTSLYIKDFHGNNERFVYYFLKQFDLRKYSSGTGVPTLNRNNVHGESVLFPDTKKEQIEIANNLDVLQLETGYLNSKYQQKLRDLEELKKSVLNKAFAGEL